MNTPMLATLAAAASMAVLSVAAAEPPAARNDPVQSLQALIGSARCETDDHCHSAPLGRKACGGPQAYLAWSTQITDRAQLERALTAHAAALEAQRLQDGRMSNCSMVPDPGAICAPVGAAGGERACRLRDIPGERGRLPTR